MSFTTFASLSFGKRRRVAHPLRGYVTSFIISIQFSRYKDPGLICKQHRFAMSPWHDCFAILPIIISIQFSRCIISFRHCSCDSKTFGLFHHGLSPYQAANPRLLTCKHDASVYFPLGTSQCLRGDGEIRTHDPLLARQVLSQLSYTPI